MEIELRGTVLSDEDAAVMRYFGWRENCCPADVTDALRTLPEGESLTVVLNSGGGDLFAGKDLFFALKKAGASCRVTTMSASAATVAMMGCGEIAAHESSLFCIHDPSVFSGGGTAEELRKTAQELDTLKDSIISVYTGRVKRSRDEIWELMRQDRWMTAREALEIGLIDRIDADAGEQNGGGQGVKVLNAVGGCFPTEEMRKRYRDEKQRERENRIACAKAYAEILNKF